MSLNAFLQKLKTDLGIEAPKGICIECGEFFSEDNVFTEDGKRETELSGMCERCFDALFV